MGDFFCPEGYRDPRRTKKVGASSSLSLFSSREPPRSLFSSRDWGAGTAAVPPEEPLDSEQPSNFPSSMVFAEQTSSPAGGGCLSAGVRALNAFTAQENTRGGEERQRKVSRAAPQSRNGKAGGVPRQPPPPRAREREVGLFGVASVSVFICMFLACPWHTRCLSPPLLPPALIRTVV